MAAPDIKVRGLRSPIPTGYVLGRVSPGTGEVQLIDITTLAIAVAATGAIASPEPTPEAEVDTDIATQTGQLDEVILQLKRIAMLLQILSDQTISEAEVA